ncbi:hypothetical protein GCM10009844_42350 [Nocardioides koreensis]|uniref:Uncharacterized protein n=2 Tax=Nocardioides koreensis TaxID=433651 RepID=A0ABP5LZZ4_9ACTN
MINRERAAADSGSSGEESHPVPGAGRSGHPGRGTIVVMTPPVLPLHMGALHPFEQVLVLLLAFGPFVALGLVIAVRRRQDRREEAAAEGQRDR